MQKLFERHWTQADRAEAAGNTALALDWLKITRKQLDQDTRWRRPATMQAITAQEERLRRKLNNTAGMHSGI